MKDNKMVQSLILFFVLFFILSSLAPIICVGNSIEEGSMSKKIDFYRCPSSNQYVFKNISYENQKKNIGSFNEITIKKTNEKNTNLMDSPWPMFCQNIQHTGQSQYSTENNPGIEKWNYKVEGLIEDTPIIDNDGNIYFGAFVNDYLYCLYPNCTLKWKYELNHYIWGSSPAIGEDGTIYVGSWDHHLYAIYPNGTTKWVFSAYDTIATSPVISNEGIIYFGVMGPGYDKGRVYALYPNGTEKWHYDTSLWIVSNPAIGTDGTIYIGSADRYVYALYPNGTLRWKFHIGDEIHSHPSIADDGTIYIGSNDGYLYAINPNGTEKWKFNTRWGMYNNPSIANDGTIYVGTDQLYALYPNGTLRWSFVFGYDEWVGGSSPAISADGTIYIGTHIGSMSGGDIVAINPDGTERWQKRIANEWVESSPSIGEDGTIYIGSSSDDHGYSYGFFMPLV